MRMEIYIAICLDIDRDAPFPIHGVSHGVCLPYHNLSSKIWKNPKNFTIEATVLGLKKLFKIFEEFNYPFNCFIEASIIEKLIKEIPNFNKINNKTNCDLGLHGLYHEDLSGEQTGIKFSREEEESILNQAYDIFESSFGIPPIGYRAPYLKISDNTFDLLSEKKFLYDSSQVITSNTTPQLENGLISQIPVLRYETQQKPFISYFWTLFERIRPVEQIVTLYREIIDKTKEKMKNSKSDSPYVLTLNLHPWHLAYSVNDKRYIDDTDIKYNTESLSKILRSISEIDNVSFVKISEILH